MSAPTDNVVEKTKPKVLHICKVYLPEKGGIQKVIHNLASAIQGYQHTVLTTSENGSSVDSMNDVRIIRCHSYGQIASMPVSPSLPLRALRQIRKHDVIAIHYPFPMAELASLLTPFSPPIVVHWHSRIIAQKKLKWLVSPFSYILLLRAKVIVVTSDRMIKQSFLLRRFQEKIVVVPYGLPPLRAVCDDKGYFLLIGRHVSYKGIDIAIRATAECGARLIIAGNGPLIEKHRQLAEELDMSDSIQFKPSMNDDEVENLLRDASALVVPSVMENEAFALVQLEAMRLAKPIINTNLNSSVPWVARDTQEAITVPPSNVTALADAMTTLMNNQQLRKQLGTNGLARFQALFTKDKFADALKDIYTRLTGG